MRSDRRSADSPKGRDLTSDGRLPRVAAFAAVLFALGAGCKDNIFTGSLTPVPPVHRVPAELEGAVILIDKDPIIETNDPNHIARANEQGVPRQLRAAMVQALGLAGFRVVDRAGEPHDLVAKLAIAVSEDGDDIRQVYRCGLTSVEGAPIAQIDWAWPKGTFVDTLEVLEFATHNVATEVATSRRVLGWLKARREGREKDRAPAADGGAPR